VPILPKSKYLIIANWKNTPETFKEAKKNFDIIKSKKINPKKIIAVICPDLLHLSELSRGYRGKILEFGAQNVNVDLKKPHTGEVSINQIKDLGVKYVIAGHAERRALGETSEDVGHKVAGIINEGLIPVLCVGELERDNEGDYLRFVEEQVIKSLDPIKKKDLNKIIIAYEPVWAIGKGKKPISTHEIHKMVIFIRKILVSRFDKKTAMEVPILYGGSVDDSNAKEILVDGEVRGLLIGRASSNPHTFSNILKSID
jgi:triosephosphate isomerase